jgi:hypothetical protein
MYIDIYIYVYIAQDITYHLGQDMPVTRCPTLKFWHLQQKSMMSFWYIPYRTIGLYPAKFNVFFTRTQKLPFAQFRPHKFLGVAKDLGF